MRRKRNYKREHKPDAIYNRVDIGRFINYLMKDGKKSIAEKNLYKAFELIQKETGEDPVKVFEKAIANASPLLEVVSRRIGGASYQIPVEVRSERKFVLGAKWIIAASREKKGKPMYMKLAEELILASKNEGGAVKKKQDMHKVAEANRAFAHFLKTN
ncbi:MAG: 30S ribosomal protein S7 [Patescibacteria group bacterium]|nr:30S ribosomal protein S7 [Patescibacteria group bacterium]MCX7589514.1 30S ribosomal protein S7 [Patescibacteria group bacterium]MDW8279936.1 30S ribosomal protein S7 [bacterium]